jgi:mRNA interferase RelE/StbE
MAYRISFKPAAQRQLRKLPRQAQARLFERIEKLAGDPYPPGVKKLKAKIDLFRVRVGDYRIIYTVQDDRFVVLVVRIGDRRDIYDR